MKFKYTKTYSSVLAATVAALALSACGTEETGSTGPVQQPTVNVEGYAVSSNNQLIPLNFQTPGAKIAPIQVLDLNGTEKIVDIDYRPADGKLYALTSDGNIYRLTVTGESTLISSLNGATLTQTASYSIDFNPTIDRLRVVGSNGDNWAVDVNTGTVTVQSNVNGASSPSVQSVAYTDRFGSTGRTTTLYTMDSNLDVLSIQAPAASGSQTSNVSLGLNVAEVKGFDINDVNQAFALVTVGDRDQLIEVDLTAGVPRAAKSLGSITPLQNGVTIRGLAIPKTANPTVMGVTDDGTLFTFVKNTSENAVAISLTGLSPAAGKLRSIDYSPSANSLIGLTTQGRLVSITLSGVVTEVATLGQALLPAVEYSMDFNPTGTPNALRVVGSNGSNWAVNQTTGAVTVQSNVNPTGTRVTDHAYINSFRMPNGVGASSTRLFAIDLTNQQLATQKVAPGQPDDGQINDVASFGTMLNRTAGFDISGLDNENALLVGYVSATSFPSLYSVNLNAQPTETALKIIGTVGTNGPVNTFGNIVDIAIQY